MWACVTLTLWFERKQRLETVKNYEVIDPPIVASARFQWN